MDRLVSGIDFRRARVIVELGVGDGCVTRELLQRMRADARLVSLEINPAFVDRARRIRDPRLCVHHACATTLPVVLEDEGVEAVDAVVSSLPLSLMEHAVVERILDIARDCLDPGGRFVQYQYSLREHHRLTRRYSDVNVGFTPFNIPPAFIYDCSQSENARHPVPEVRPRLGAFYASALAAVAFLLRAFQDL